MRLLHELAKIHATFDDPNLVSHAGLVPVMALAQRAGLGGLAAEHVRLARPPATTTPGKALKSLSAVWVSPFWPPVRHPAHLARLARDRLQVGLGRQPG